MSKDDLNKPDGKNRIVDEHFWFTAITLTFNAFAVDKFKDEINSNLIFIASSIISFYAIFLILERAATYSGRIKYPKWLEKIEENKKMFYHKGFETLLNIWISIKMIPMVIFEFSGAFFYILLVVFSYLGVLLLS
jgi:hypothetical protein